jgi:hypothetical protein
MTTEHLVVSEPPRVQRLRHDKHGRPVPWFVAWIDGRPDFRILRSGAFEMAMPRSRVPLSVRYPTGWKYRSALCWVCGFIFHRQEDRVFVIGPMCTVNRISSEPPSHIECAVYAALACPFLSHPNMVRRTTGLEELDTRTPGGVMLMHNPGVSVVWVTKANAWGSVETDPDGGKLVRIGPPMRVEWYTQGRFATRAEAEVSIDAGLPKLIDAAGVKPGSKGMAQIEHRKQEALAYLPAV